VKSLLEARIRKEAHNSWLDVCDKRFFAYRADAYMGGHEEGSNFLLPMLLKAVEALKEGDQYNRSQALAEIEAWAKGKE
jgi:hypothetical protein